MSAPARTDNLAAAAAILDKPADDLGDFELAEAQARATVALAEELRKFRTELGRLGLTVSIADA